MAAAVRLERTVLLLLQKNAEQLPDLLFIVYDQRGCFFVHAKLSTKSGRRISTGTTMTNSAPRGCLLAAVTLPPCARTKPSTIARPSPVPPRGASDPRRKISKMRG